MEIATPEKTSTEFIKKFSVLDIAKIGVVMVPTRDINRAIMALTNYALDKQYDFKLWNNLVGWEDLQKNDGKPPERDKSCEVFAAMKKIDDVDGGGKLSWPRAHKGGIYVMVYPHYLLSKHSGLIQCVKDYASRFPLRRSSVQRLVMLVPEETTLPPELQTDVTVLEYALPNKSEIREIFKNVVLANYTKANVAYPFNSEQTDTLINLCSGMSEIEIENALSRGLAEFRSGNYKPDDFSYVKTITFVKYVKLLSDIKTEVIKRSECLSLLPEAHMDDIGGLDLLKNYLRGVAVALSERGKKAGLDRPRGISIIGPPGTGKTLCAKASGSILNQRVVRLDVGAIFNKFVGGSEERIRSAIKLAKTMAPVILFIDEVDKMGLGGSGDSGVGMRILGTLLNEMQECKEEVFWVFTGNYPELIDPALTRKGRIDEVFAVVEPNRAERLEVLRIHLKMRGETLDPEKLHATLEATKGFVSSEIQAIVIDARKNALLLNETLEERHLVEAANQTNPICKTAAEKFEAMRKWAETFARPSSTRDTETNDEVITKTSRTREV